MRKYSNGPTFPTLVLAALAMALWVAATAVGSQATDASEAAARGAVTYRVYCGRCHGPTGKGDGKLGATLKVKPADLTTIASRHGGEFRRDEVQSRIDGRETLEAHAASDMPAWGLSFQDASKDASQEKEIRARLADLVAYLETLQVPPAK
jgi:mono/diheme cytochrome c family protein